MTRTAKKKITRKKATKKKVARRETHTRKVSPPAQEYYVVADELSGAFSTNMLRDDGRLSRGIPVHNNLEDAKDYAESWDSDTLPVIYIVTPVLRGTRSIKVEPYIEQ
jgi:hypothetical protein